MNRFGFASILIVFCILIVLRIWIGDHAREAGHDPVRLLSRKQAPALNNANQDHDDRQEQQNVDEPSQRIRGNQSKGPQEKQ
jgi:hypothetical protein